MRSASVREKQGMRRQSRGDLFYPMLMHSPQNIFSAIVAAPFGAIGIRTEAGCVRELVYLPPHFDEKAPTEALAEKTAIQLERYFAEPDFRFDLPLAPAGTAFQQKVWQVIASIPRGEVLTYGAVARLIGSAPRAVGQACGANWFPLVLPCHRVPASGGWGGGARRGGGAGGRRGGGRGRRARGGGGGEGGQPGRRRRGRAATRAA